jgi:UDP-glucose 4-epimerase
VATLVTGGAGYIGSHVVRLLRERGDAVIVVDDLVTGIAARVAGTPLVQLDLASFGAPDVLTSLMLEHGVDSVIHFAARKRVDESVQRPAWYYQQNVGSTANVLLAVERANVQRFVFSSSAAVYGNSDGASIDESTVPGPVNPYGQTKLVGEWMLQAASVTHQLRAASLRYFNVAGAGWPELADTAVLNLVPMVFERLRAGQPPIIFGNDYATADGTCVRDYVHVLDLAEAHLATLDFLATGEPRHEVLNVGTGSGSSVLQMVNEIIRVSEVDLKPEFRPRRSGDPAAVVADVGHIWRTLGWKSKLGLPEIVASAWEGTSSQLPAVSV